MKLIYRLTQKDLGEGAVTFEWRPGGSYVAVSGANKHVKVLDRNGGILEEIIQPGLVTSMTWDKDGDLLALTNDKTTVVTLWEVGTKKTETLDASMGSKESPTFALWSRKSPILAVGNTKGNLMIYNHRTSRKIPVLGKHQRAITCGAFSDSDLLALGADDASITVSNMEGDSIYSFTCNSDPSMIKFNDLRRPADKGAKSDTMLSAVLGKKILMLVSLSDSENPINLQFQARYGDIVSYVWFLDGYMLLGFDKGYVVCISAHTSEIGQEIFSVQDFKTYLSYVCVSEAFEKALMVGDSQLKIREMNQLGEIFGMYDIEGEDNVLNRVETSDDGQLIAVSGASGTLNVFLTKMPVLGATYRDIIAILSSLTEITVLRESEKVPLAIFSVKLEPSVIAVGPLHVAIAMNNRAWFYELRNDGCAEMVCEFEYMSTVNAMQINYEYAVAKLDGRAQLHRMRNRQGAYDSEESGIMFPDSEHNNARLQDIGLTDSFFIYCTDGGHLHYFSLEDSTYVNEYRHVAGIRMIFPEADGIRLCFFDDRLDAYIYSPVDDALSKVPNIESTAHFTSCLWENFTVDRDTFVICDTNTLHVFLISKEQIDGHSLMKIGTTRIPYGHKPLMLCKGIVHCQTQSGRTGTVLLESHKTDMVLEGKSPAALQKLLDQALVLKRWLNAWRICDFTKNKEHWRKYAFAAMQNADVELAIRVLKQTDEVAMVWALEEVQFIEERNLLAGHLSLIMEQFDIAETHFLRSSRPKEALDMRRDLMHWDKALQLANRLAPEEIPYISKEYAQQLEFIGEYSTALLHYENGVIQNAENDSEEILDHNEICNSGIARMSIRTGDIRRGIKMASELDGRAVKKDCALILEQMKQYGDAALLYEMGHFYDRAAAVCLKAKNWTKVGDLLTKVRSPKIHAQYGKVMEGEKKYKQAAVAYKNARDYDNLVRILLDYLDMPEEAVRVVKESRSVEGAKLVAKFFGRLGDQVSAIQFLVLSQCQQEAFQLAESEQKMDIYAEAIDDDGTIEQFSQLAEYYASKKNYSSAGKYHYKAGHYNKAIDFLLLNGEDSEALKTAIECVAEARDPELSKRLTDFLMGEIDGIPKDAKFLFRYYIAMQMNNEAAKTAIIIAREEQARGSYRMAHQLLFGMHQELVQKGIKVPSEMQNNLMLLHSYLIVKSLVKRGEHMKASRMLIRVANNISRFPAHVVPILTSAVIECTKAGLKSSAFNYAAQLLKPENRKKIDEKYRKRIEAIVRKSDRTADEKDKKSACPYCESVTEESELVCNSCKNLIPYCIITGRHILSEDFALCPSCNFPGYFSEFKKLSETGECCPMCGGDLRDVVPSDAKKFLGRINPIQNGFNGEIS